jgi:hypothetical protein
MAVRIKFAEKGLSKRLIDAEWRSDLQSTVRIN